ncbi:MAG TPA: hypothetical protein VHJ82_05265, partial [Actinomycetota bacterium]|nr:hypothetical protein [Actinomycetota bacterium]
LPDLYDTDYSSPGGVGPWDLMAMGAYGFDGGRPWRPTPLSAWSKAQLGWARPQDVTRDITRVSIPAAESAHEGAFTGTYRLLPRGEAGASHHLLVENRQSVGWADDFPTSGLAIWRVDTSQSGNSNDSQRLLSLVQADGLDELGTPGRGYATGDAGDLFPGSTGTRGFSLAVPTNAGGTETTVSLAVWAIGDPDVITVADLYVSSSRLPPVDDEVPPSGEPADRPIAETTPTPLVTPLPSPLEPLQPRSDGRPPRIRYVLDDPDPFTVRSGPRKRRFAIKFYLSENAAVTIAIKRSGRLIRFLLRNQPRREGEAAVIWSGRNRRGDLVRPGRYVYVIKARDAHGNRTRPVRGRVLVRR